MKVEKLATGQILVKVRALGHETESSSTARIGHRDTVDRGVARGRKDQPREHLDGRRLARAVGPDEAEDLAFFHVEIDAAHGLDRSQQESCAKALA